MVVDESDRCGLAVSHKCASGFSWSHDFAVEANSRTEYMPCLFALLGNNRGRVILWRGKRRQREASPELQQQLFVLPVLAGIVVSILTR